MRDFPLKSHNKVTVVTKQCLHGLLASMQAPMIPAIQHDTSRSMGGRFIEYTMLVVHLRGFTSHHVAHIDKSSQYDQAYILDQTALQQNEAIKVVDMEE